MSAVEDLSGGRIILDCFAGAGGASAGIRAALGRGPDIAIDHNPVAIGVHRGNHPEAVHLTKDVWGVDPRTVAAGRHVNLAWFSPDCRHFSKAKGGKCVSDRVRGLAWYVCEWSRIAPPDIIVMENVEEFRTWGPLIKNHFGVWRPDPERIGETFADFIRTLRGIGYQVQHCDLRACDYGAPTIRRRMILIARRDGRPIVWPRPTHGPGLLPYRTAADIIDWSIPCQSIFDRRRPLAQATMRRIADGLYRYVIRSGERYLVPGGGYHRLIGSAESAEWLAYHTSQEPATEPSIESAAWLAQHNTGAVGRSVAAPISTVTATGSQQALVTAVLGREPSPAVHAFIVQYYGTSSARSLAEPLPTVSSNDRFGLVTAHGDPRHIVDIGMRMLTPRELARAQGFQDDYVFDRTVDGKRVSRAEQTRLIGNSVCPPLAEAIVRANI